MVMTGDVRVPDDIALIGYDDIDFAASAVIPLSSVRQPAALIGSTAMDLLLGIASGEREPEQVVFRPELRVRETSVVRAAPQRAPADQA
jgi:LacI family transcriptional regulator